MLQLRAMTKQDLPVILDIEKQAHYHPWTKENFIDSLHSNSCWVLEQGDSIIGYGILKIVLDEAELLNITIAPDKQKQGFGQQLLTLLMTKAHCLQAKECFLEVRESNTTAYRLYEQYGFNELGRRRNYYPTAQGYEDALLMGHTL